MNDQQQLLHYHHRRRRRRRTYNDYHRMNHHHHPLSFTMMTSSSSLSSTSHKRYRIIQQEQQPQFTTSSNNNNNNNSNYTTTTTIVTGGSARIQEEEEQQQRPCNILTILPITDINQTLIDFRVYIEVSAYLAWAQYNDNYHNSTYTKFKQQQLLSSNKNKSNDNYYILPHLHDRLSSCPKSFHLSTRDSQFSALNAVRVFSNAYTTGTTTISDGTTTTTTTTYYHNNNQTYPEGSFLDDLQEILQQNDTEATSNDTTTMIHHSSGIPHVVIGAGRSAESSALHFLASAYDIPQISGSSTAAYLDNKDVYPLFARTVPTNRGDAQAMAIYLQYLNVSHVGILYINDGYGNDFHQDLIPELKALHIRVISEPYDDTSIESSIKQLALSQLKYFIAILNPRTYESVVRYSVQYNIAGRSDYFWLFGESSLQFIDSSFQLSIQSQSDIALALHGSAVLSATVQPYPALDDAILQFWNSIDQQLDYINTHDEPEIFHNFTFVKPTPSLYQYLIYDAVTAMMLAACEVELNNDDDMNMTNVTGTQIYQQLLKTEFQGVSGYVSFDPKTGTRTKHSVMYGVYNVLFPDNFTTSESYHVSSSLSYLINLSDIASSVPVEIQNSFIYASNTSVPPIPLPTYDIDMNLIPPGLRAFGLCLGVAVMVISIYWLSWTLFHRTKDVVKASQPIFLCQICIGTFIISSAVIPMSLQEPISIHGLNIACMAAPWLISVGFVTAFSALFTKTWRLNKLFHHSRNLRRVVVRPRDVALPFIVLMIFNIAVMTAWTIDAPLIWVRQDVDNYDLFNRSIESIGSCVPSNGKGTTIYLSLIVAINIFVLIFAIYQAYVARNLPTEFSESTYISVAMSSLLEVCVLGIPLLFLSSGDPTVSYMIRSILVSVSGLSVLLPIFVPKYIQRNVNQRYHDVVVAETGAAPSKGKIVISMGTKSTITQQSNGDGQQQNHHNGDMDHSDSEGIAPGLTKIRRNQEYFKERRISYTQREKSEHLSRRRSSKIRKDDQQQGIAGVDRLSISSSEFYHSSSFGPMDNVATSSSNVSTVKE